MRKLFLLLLAAILTISPGLRNASAAQAAEKEVTILVYVCGSDLESRYGEASGDIREMASSGIGNSGAASVYLATGGATRWQGYNFSSGSVQYYKLEGGGPVLVKDAGKMSMGDARTLSSFIRFGISAAPAKRYILILWDHGGGPVFGLCNDENYRDEELSLQELRTALSDGLQGKKLDIIGFDCCLMNCVDLCADMVGLADYSVVSQELVSGTGLNYDEWMKPIADNPAISSEKIAMTIVDTYIAENSRGRDATTATMSVISSAKMPDVVQAANAFSKSLTSLLSSNLAGVVRLRTQLTSFGEFLDSDASDLVDVSDMCDAFSALLPQESASLKEAAAQAVCYNSTTGDIAQYAHGMSFFLPYQTVSGDRQEILSHYSAENSAYATLATSMTSQVASSGYVMSASSYTPGNFYSSYNDSCSGSFCDIWDGYYGDYFNFNDVYSSCGGDIWAGLNTTNGSVWDGYSSSSGIWGGYNDYSYGNNGYNGSGYGAETTPSTSGIWAGLPGTTQTTQAPQTTAQPQPTGQPAQPAQNSASAALNNIWAGLLNQGSEYYQPGEANQNVQAGVSEAVTAESVLETANDYFSSVPMTAQMIYSIQLNRNDLDHLSSASGVLSREEGGETIRLGNIGQTTIDWSTGLVFSMFDGSWPMLGGQMVRAEILYGDEEGNVRFVIPARVNGLKMYLLGNYSKDGETTLLGATQGYDENGFAIRGVIPLEAGMTIYPLFTAVSADGTEREYEGSALTIPGEGLELTWSQIPAGRYLYCFGLTDLSGQVHYTDNVPLSF